MSAETAHINASLDVLAEKINDLADKADELLIIKREMQSTRDAIDSFPSDDEADLRAEISTQLTVISEEYPNRKFDATAFRLTYSRAIAIERHRASNKTASNSDKAHAVFDEVLNMEDADPEILVDRIRDRLSQAFSDIYDESWTPGTEDTPSLSASVSQIDRSNLDLT